MRFGSFSRSFRSIALIAILVGSTAAEAGVISRRLLAKINEHTPAPVLVMPGQEMEQAEEIASKCGGTVFWGVGESMEPLYAPNTAIVIREVQYDDIKKGMTVVYRKPNGRVVAHAVIGEDANGYIVQGVNNSEPDAVSVNESNLVGVIAAAFSANDTQFRAALARKASDASSAIAMR